MRKVDLAVFFLLAAAPATLSAQRPEAGTWGGTVTPPESVAVPVSYLVRQSGDSLSITLTVPGVGSFDLRNLAFTGDRMTFSWAPGDTMATCQLMRRGDGSWAGPCRDSNGGMGAMLMTPPKKPGGAAE
jgi:hypothetical protein